jgi:hypothetical protein
MRRFYLVAAIACAVAVGAAYAPTAAAYSCSQCQDKCNGLPFGRGLCREGCKAICKAAKKVEDTVKPITRKVMEIGGRAFRLIRTAYSSAEELWEQIKNLRMPLAGRWSASKNRQDLRPKLADYGIEVKRQFHSTCMAHAMSSALEYATIPYLMADKALAKKALGKSDARGLNVSRFHIYYLSRHGLQACNPKTNTKFGSWALQAASWLQKDGTFDEKYWPFENWNPADVRKYGSCILAATNGRPPAAGLANRHFRIGEFYYLPGVPLPGKASIRRVSDIKGILEHGYPVVITVFTFPEDLWDGAGGKISLPKKVLTKPESAHYVLIVGFNDKTNRFTILNSWGTKWGDKGFGYLPYDYVRRYAIEGLFIKTSRVK